MGVELSDGTRITNVRRLGSLMQPIELTPKSSMNPVDPYGLTFQELVQTVKEVEEEMMSMMVEYKKTVYGATDVIPSGKVSMAMDPMGAVEMGQGTDYQEKMKEFREYLKMLRRFEDALKAAKEVVKSEKE